MGMGTLACGVCGVDGIWHGVVCWYYVSRAPGCGHVLAACWFAVHGWSNAWSTVVALGVEVCRAEAGLCGCMCPQGCRALHDDTLVVGERVLGGTGHWHNITMHNSALPAVCWHDILPLSHPIHNTLTCTLQRITRATRR